MAINTSTITKLISDFRALSQKDSISPESLGILLQRLADLINTAAADIDFNAISNALNNVPTALVSISQGTADRNDILMDVTSSNLVKGIRATTRNLVFIRQATTERAGAMRAQQVIDLNNTRSGLDSLQKIVSTLSEMVNQQQTTVSTNSEQLTSLTEMANYCSEGIADLAENMQVTNNDLAATHKSVEENAKGISSIKAKTDCPRIAVEVVNGKLRIINCNYYKENNYALFVFRFTSKRNRCTLENYPNKKRGAKHKGWHIIGGLPNNVKLDSYGFVMFRTSPLEEWGSEKDGVYSHSYEAKYVVGAKGTAENIYVPWGRKKVKVMSKQATYLMRRFRFAIGFGKAYDRNVFSLSPAMLASNLAEFSVIFDPCTKEFHMGK